jgi:hypothetical protein
VLFHEGAWKEFVRLKCKLLPAACCLLPAACCLLPAACCLLLNADARSVPAGESIVTEILIDVRMYLAKSPIMYLA